MIGKIEKVLKDVITIIKKPVMSVLPGKLAFSFVLTIIPMLVLLAIAASIFNLSLDTITGAIIESFPKAVSSLLLPLITGRGFDFNVFLYLISAFILASGGAYSIITVSDVIYDLKPQNVISKRIKAFIMTFVFITLIMFLFIVPAFGDKILSLLTSISTFEGIKKEITTAYFILKYPISILLIYVNIKLIYTMAPNKEIKSKSVTTGAMFTTISWLLITQIYSFWVGNIAHYDIFYGSISNIIILLMWMYFLAYIFVIGLVLNKGISIEKENKL